MIGAKKSTAYTTPSTGQPAHTTPRAPSPQEIFSDTPDTNYFYDGGPHRRAYDSLVHAIECGRGFVTLTGTPGTGKTTLLFKLLEHYRGSACTVFVYQTQCTPRELLRLFLADASLESSNKDFVRMHLALNELLLKVHKQGKRFLGVIDEAHNLSPETLETVRLLSDFETPKEKLLQIVLCGQLPLEERLFNPDQLQLRQRVSTFCRLRPLTPHETFDYINYRWKKAGIAAPLPFTASALAAIANFSEGIPRNIHRICFGALCEANAHGLQIIDDDLIVKTVCVPEGDEPGEAPPAPYSSIPYVARTTSAASPIAAGVRDVTSDKNFSEQSRAASVTYSNDLPSQAAHSSSPAHGACAPQDLAKTAPLDTNVSETASETTTAMKFGGAVQENAPAFIRAEESETTKSGAASLESLNPEALQSAIPSSNVVSPSPRNEESASDFIARLRARSEAEFTSASESRRRSAGHGSHSRLLALFVLGIPVLAIICALAVFGPKLIERYYAEPSQLAEPSVADASVPPVQPSSSKASAPRGRSGPGQSQNYVPEQRRVEATHQSEAPLVSGGNTPIVTAPFFDREPSLPISMPQTSGNAMPQPTMATSIPPPAVELKRSADAPRPPSPTGGKIKFAATPIYPSAARAMNIQGKVVLSATIGANGTLKDIHVVSGHPLLVAAAMDAARKMQYQPYQVGDKKIEAPTQIVFDFKLGDSYR